MRIGLFTVIILIISSSVAYCCSNNKPVADLTAYPVYAAIDVNIGFDGSASYDSDGSIVEYRWDFGDGSDYSYDDILTSHPYSSPGNYTVTLRVIDDDSATDTDTCIVTIYNTVYVDPNASGNNDGTGWDNAYNYLQDALDVAITDSNGEIWVADGIYKPDEESIGSDHDVNDANETFQLEGIAIYGGFGGYNDGNETSLSQRDFVNNKTILSGDIGIENDVNDNCYHVVTSANSVILDGFTIMGGNANGTDANSNGGGIYCSSSDLTVERCIITANNAVGDGGGIYCDESGLNLTNCVIVNNDANNGGGIYDSNSSLALTNCTFSKNDANTGGGIYNKDSSIQMNNCILWGNTATDSGASIYNYGLDEPNDSNLVSWWKFEEGTGTDANDSAGTNDGTLNGDTNWVTGIIGDYALDFDGDGDYVALPDNDPVWLPENNFTLSVWVYFENDLGSPREYILDLNHADSSTSSNELGYCITREGVTGKLTFRMTTTANPDEDLVADTVLDKDTWYHIVAVRDGTTQALYVDGGFDKDRTCSSSPIDFVGGYDDDKVNIGRFSRSGAETFYLKGTIDDVRIYDRALSSEEIRA